MCVLFTFRFILEKLFSINFPQKTFRDFNDQYKKKFSKQLDKLGKLKENKRHDDQRKQTVSDERTDKHTTLNSSSAP